MYPCCWPDCSTFQRMATTAPRKSRRGGRRNRQKQTSNLMRRNRRNQKSEESIEMTLSYDDSREAVQHGLDDNDFHLWLSQSQPALIAEPTLQMGKSAVNDTTASTNNVQMSSMTRIPPRRTSMNRLDDSDDVTLMLPQNDPMNTTNHGMHNDDLHLWLSQSQPAASQPTVSLDESTVSDLSTSAASVQAHVREIQQIIKQNNNYLMKQNDVLFKLVNDISVHVAEISDKMGYMEKNFGAINTTVKNNKDVIGEVQRIVERLQKSNREIKKRVADNKSDQIEVRLKTLEDKFQKEMESRDGISNYNNDASTRSTNTVPSTVHVDNTNQHKNIILIYNLPYGMQDRVDVNQLLHDGLGLHLDVKTVTRAPSANNRAGVLTVDLNSRDDVIKVMQSKMRLRNHHTYYEVYIEEKDHHRDSRIEEKFRMLMDNMQYRGYQFSDGNQNIRTHARYTRNGRNGRYRNNHNQQ